MSNVAELLTTSDRGRFRFVRYPPMRVCPDGSLRYETWRDRWTEALASFFWPRGSFVVTHIDREAGKITIGDAR
jgi:hypothetical protein